MLLAYDVSRDRFVETASDAGYTSAQEFNNADWAYNDAQSDSGSSRDPSTYSHLPNLSATSKTSLPISLANHELAESLLSLLNEKVFSTFLRDPLGRHNYKDWLSTVGSANLLRAWEDTEKALKLESDLERATCEIQSLYLDRCSEAYLEPGSETERAFAQSLVHLGHVRNALGSVQVDATDRLYSTTFHVSPPTMSLGLTLTSYPASVSLEVVSAVDNLHVRLGKPDLRLDRDNIQGLGDCYCLTNPRAYDNPIVLVSPGFEAVTGYDRFSILGRNCRFLQGPQTNPNSVARIREALKTGVSVVELLLNYRADGTPFFCAVNILPLYDSRGNLCYFVGGQININGVIASQEPLSFLLGSTPKPEDATEALQSHIKKVMTPPVTNVPPTEGDGKKKGFFKRSTRPNLGPNGDGTVHSQMLPGAEIGFKEAKPIDEQVDTFRQIYERFLVVRLEGQKILFASVPLLEFLGLPTSTSVDRYDSKVLQSKLGDILESESKGEAKALRSSVTEAMDRRAPLTVQGKIRIIGSKSRLFGKADVLAMESCVFHLTPLLDRLDDCAAYIVLVVPTDSEAKDAGQPCR